MNRYANFFLLFAAPALSLTLGLLGLETLSHNRMGWFLLAAGMAYPAASIASCLIRKAPLWVVRGQVVQEEKNDKSFWVILPGMIAAFFVPPLEYLYIPDRLPRFTALDNLGIGLVLAGIALGLRARLAIKGQYSGHLQVIQDQSLVTTGPYRWMRHPSYAGFILVTVGIAVGYGSYIGLLVIALLLLPALAFRIGVEDALLEVRFGDIHRDYQKRVKKLIPGIW